MIDIGSARLGITVAERLRRNKKITMTTRHTVSNRVNCTSRTESRIDWDRSKSVSSDTAAGIWARKEGIKARILFTTSTVLTPGWRWMANTMPRRLLNQLAILSFCTLSITRPISLSRTGRPLR